jgi:hypothetical protein
MTFTKTIISAIKSWINSNFVSHSKQALTDVQKEQVRKNIGLIEETPDDALELLVEMSVLKATTNEEGFVLTDENNNILTI